MSKKTVKKTPVKKVTPIKSKPPGGQVRKPVNAPVIAKQKPSADRIEILRLQNENAQLKNLMSTLKNTIVWQNVKMMDMENQG